MSIRHQVEAELPLDAEREAEMRRHRGIIVTKRYCSTSRMQSHKRWLVCAQAALIKTKSEACKRSHYARPRLVSLDECSCTRRPRGGKLWAPRNGRRRPDRPGGGKDRRGDGRIVLGEEMRLQRTSSRHHLNDYPGRDFTPSEPVQNLR